MATFVLIPGAGDVAWTWSFVAAELRALGHDPVAIDFPCDDDSAGWSEYVDTVVAAMGLLPGRGTGARGGGARTRTGPVLHADARAVAARRLAGRPDPLRALPRRSLLPAEWMRGVVRDRLGIAPDEIDGGHCPFLSRPKGLAARLDSYWRELRATRSA